MSDIQCFMRTFAKFYSDGLIFIIIIVVVWVFVHNWCLFKAYLIWHINIIIEEVWHYFHLGHLFLWLCWLGLVIIYNSGSTWGGSWDSFVWVFFRPHFDHLTIINVLSSCLNCIDLRELVQALNDTRHIDSAVNISASCLVSNMKVLLWAIVVLSDTTLSTSIYRIEVNWSLIIVLTSYSSKSLDLFLFLTAEGASCMALSRCFYSCGTARVSCDIFKRHSNFKSWVITMQAWGRQLLSLNAFYFIIVN